MKLVVKADDQRVVGVHIVSPEAAEMIQMIAIAVLFSQGVFEHYLAVSVEGVSPEQVSAILSHEAEDIHGLVWKEQGMLWAGYLGLTLLWMAAALTLITGWDYFVKAWPHLRDDR